MKNTSLDTHEQKIDGLINELPLPLDVKNKLVGSKKLKYLFSSFGSAFQACFPGIATDELLLIDTGTFLLAAGTYAVDNVYDLQVEGLAIQKRLMYGHFCHQESQRLLSQLFLMKDPFWEKYYNRYSNHFKELKVSRELDDELTFTRYTELLGYKYSLLNLPIDIMHHLTDEKNTDNYETILESLKWFTVGYNLPNEVKGLEEDLMGGINNYAWWRLKAQLEKLDIPFAHLSPEALHKLLYATGLAEQLLNESFEAFQKALDIVSHLNVPGYITIVKHRLAKNKRMKTKIEEHLTVLEEA